LYHTGNLLFNQQLYRRALERGFRLGEYGLEPSSPIGIEQPPTTLFPVKSEEDVFKVLEMEFVPPEMRSL
jgi:DNA polymerase/3'-5' exonuclease PolX